MTDVVWKGSDVLREHLVEVRTLRRFPRNPRRGQVRLIADSLDRFGQVRPILVDAKSRIVAGNHTFMAVKELGWTHVAAIPNKFRNEAEAKAYLLADNRLPELGHYEQDQLLALLEEVEATGGWGGTGYEPDDLEDLRAAQDAVPLTAAEDFAGGFAASAEEIAARQLALAGGAAMRELVLMLTPRQNADFETHLRIIRKEYGGGGVTDAVARAVAEQAALA